jgi:hypothetical protein
MPGARAVFVTDIDASQVEYSEYSHCHAKSLQGVVDLAWRCAFEQHALCLATIRVHHAVADEPVLIG